MYSFSVFLFFFFFNDTATTEIYTLSLHDALPISEVRAPRAPRRAPAPGWAARSRRALRDRRRGAADRKSTRLNSSHLVISYAVFCLKKKNKQEQEKHDIYSLLRKHATSVEIGLSL